MFYSTQEKSQTNATNVNMHPLESTPWRKVKQMPKYTATPTLHVLFNNPNKDIILTHYPLLLPIIMLPLVTTVHSLIIIASKNIIKPKHILHISPVNVAYVLCHNKIKVQFLESVHKVKFPQSAIFFLWRSSDNTIWTRWQLWNIPLSTLSSTSSSLCESDQKYLSSRFEKRFQNKAKKH